MTEATEPPEGSLDWLWYHPPTGPWDYVSTCEINCYPCDVSWRVTRDVVRPRCFVCGKFKKRPYIVTKRTK